MRNYLSNYAKEHISRGPVLRVNTETKRRRKKTRIPTVIDRMLQQAINQVLQPLFEPEFSDNSYGFRPNRST